MRSNLLQWRYLEMRSLSCENFNNEIKFLFQAET
jgi:hypothetical protein